MQLAQEKVASVHIQRVWRGKVGRDAFLKAHGDSLMAQKIIRDKKQRVIRQAHRASKLRFYVSVRTFPKRRAAEREWARRFRAVIPIQRLARGRMGRNRARRVRVWLAEDAAAPAIRHTACLRRRTLSTAWRACGWQRQAAPRHARM